MSVWVLIMGYYEDLEEPIVFAEQGVAIDWMRRTHPDMPVISESRYLVEFDNRIGRWGRLYLRDVKG